MKKIITFILSLCLMLSSLVAFSACGEPVKDPAPEQKPKHEHTFGEGTLLLPTTEENGVTEVSTCTGCGEVKRELIPFSKTTKEKWLAMLSPENYTVTISYGTGDKGIYTVTEDGYSLEDVTRGVSAFFLKENDGWYKVALSNGDYTSTKLAIAPKLSLGDLIMPGMDEEFDNFVYSEEWSAYVHKRQGTKYFIYTAGDTLVRIIGFGGEDLENVTPDSEPCDEYSVFVFDFHDYGTTKLDIPDYK